MNTQATRSTGRIERRSRVSDLVRLLDQVRSLYEQLFSLIDAKLDAMRRCDIDAMRVCNDRENALAKRLEEREGLRRQLVDAIGEELGLPSRAARLLTITQIANRLPQAQRTRLMESVGRLRQSVAKVSQANRVSGAVTRGIVDHLRWVFAAVRGGEEAPAGYSRGGAVVSHASGPLFDAVG